MKLRIDSLNKLLLYFPLYQADDDESWRSDTWFVAWKRAKVTIAAPFWKMYIHWETLEADAQQTELQTLTLQLVRWSVYRKPAVRLSAVVTFESGDRDVVCLLPAEDHLVLAVITGCSQENHRESGGRSAGGRRREKIWSSFTRTSDNRCCVWCSDEALHTAMLQPLEIWYTTGEVDTWEHFE